MFHSWLRFPTRISIHSRRTVPECIDSLKSLTAPPNSFSINERVKPFRGKIGPTHGWLRLPCLTFQMTPTCNLLVFDVTADGSGTKLSGELRLLNRFRVPVGIYLTICVTSELVEIVRLAMGRESYSLFQLCGGIISFLMIYGWTRWVLFLNRRNDSQLIKAVEYAVVDDRGAKIVSDLLSFSNKSGRP